MNSQLLPRVQHSFPREALSPSRWVITLGLLSLAALGLRLVAIDRHSFWYDEAVSAELARASYSKLFTGQARDDGNPPLYWMIARAWSQAFGSSEVAFRTFPLLCGVLSVPLLGLLGRRLLGPRIGLLAAGLLAISPFALELSNEARVYALLLLLTLANAWHFLRWMEQRRLVDLGMYTLTLTLCFYSHYYAVGLPIVHGLALCASGSARRLFLPWSAAVAIAAALFIPCLSLLATQVRTPGNLIRSADSWKAQFLATPVVFSLGRTFAWRGSPPGRLALAMGVSVLAFLTPALWGLYCLRRRPFTAVLLGTWLLGPVLGPLMIALLFTPLYSVRYAYLAVPAFLLLLAEGLVRSRSSVRLALLACILVTTAVSDFRYAHEPLKQDWRTTAQTLQTKMKPNAVLAFDGDIGVTALRYYTDRKGFVPPLMVGLVDTARSEGEELRGTVFQEGHKLTPAPQACTTQLLATDEVWLALCVAEQPLPFYRDFFRRHGYELVDEYQLERIELYRFTATKDRSPVALTPPSAHP